MRSVPGSPQPGWPSPPGSSRSGRRSGPWLSAWPARSWPVVVLVSCMPVVTLGFGAALTHLLGAPGERTGSAPPVRTRVRRQGRTRSAPPTAADAREHFREELARGEVPSQRRIKDELGGGWDRVRQIHESLINEPRDDLTAEL